MPEHVSKEFPDGDIERLSDILDHITIIGKNYTPRYTLWLKCSCNRIIFVELILYCLTCK